MYWNSLIRVIWYGLLIDVLVCWLDVGVGGGYLEFRFVCYVIGLDGEGGFSYSKGIVGVGLG